MPTRSLKDQAARLAPWLLYALALAALGLGGWRYAVATQTIAHDRANLDEVAIHRIQTTSDKAFRALALGSISGWLDVNASDPATISVGPYLAYRAQSLPDLQKLPSLPLATPHPAGLERLRARWIAWVQALTRQAASVPPDTADPRPWLYEEAAAWRPVEHALVHLLADDEAAVADCRATLHEHQQRALFEGPPLVLLALVLWLIGRRWHSILRRPAPATPLEDLAAAMRAVTQGDLTARAPVRGTGPEAQFATDFNDMVAVLVETLAAEQAVVEELRRKTADLEAANRHKSEFIARVSHELKTPLNAIIGFADLMSAGRPGPLTDKQRDYCQRIFGAGQHLLAIISDLIDLSRLDLGALALQPAPTELAAVIHEVVDLLAPQLAAKEHTLQQELAADLGTLTLDRRRLVQVLLNLLSNAIKFTPPGGTLTVAARRDEEAGAVVLTVADTGIGIAPADQERIFAEFVQLESPLQRHHEGVGIGLALSRRLVTLMGGELTLASAPGSGSTFTVILPLVDEEEADTAGSTGAASAPRGAP